MLDLKKHRLWPWLSVSLLIVIIDQTTKLAATQWLSLQQIEPILPGLNLVLIHNTGAAFSLLSDAGGWQRWFFISTSLVVSLIILNCLYKIGAYRSGLSLALSMILGGAVGNLLDRIFYADGHVIDFIQIYYQKWAWPTFNIADMAITIGAILFIIDTVKSDRYSQI